MSPPVIIWLPQLLAGLASVCVGAYVWRRRTTHGARTLLVLMMAAAEWSLLSALHKAMPDLAAKLLVAKFQYLGIVTVPPALLVFVLQYCGEDRWVKGRYLWWLFLIPALTSLLVWSNEFHGLIWKSVVLNADAPSPIAVYHYASFFWVWVVYSYGLLLISSLFLVRAWRTSERFYRMQVNMMLVGIAAPWVSNAVYLFQISPWPLIDMTPISFAATSVFLGVGMFWGRILDVVPVAHNTVLKNMTDAVVVLDRHHRIANLNTAARHLLGLDNFHVIGWTASEAFTHVPVLMSYVLHETVEIQTEISFGYEGTPRHFDLHVSLIQDRRGRPLGRLMTLHDVTKRKDAEEALRTSEYRYRTLTESIPLAIFQTDRKGRLTFANQAALDLFGFKSGEAKKDLDVFSLIAPEDRDRALANFGRRLGGGNIGEEEYTVIKRDGTHLPVLLYADVLFQNEATEGFQGFLIDQSERKRAEEEKRKIEARLLHAQKMEAIGTLAGGVAHDFNNLLMAIQGRTSLFALEGNDRSSFSEHLKEIEACVRRGANLTKQLLGFARSGKYEVKPWNINHILLESSKLFGRTRKEISIQTKLEKSLWTAEVDRGQLEQTFLNLFVNAWHAMPSGGKLFLETENVTLKEALTGHRRLANGRYVKIKVMDTGIGMSKEVQSRIFDPFFTTREFGDGTGMGLASAYGILRNHGGHIEVESTPGQGAAFTLYLPASEGEAVKETEILREVQPGNGTILVADDEHMVAEVARDMLKAVGYHVLTAGSGREAIDAYRENENIIDLVVLDLIMPGMGGREVYDQLRAINPDIRVLLSSGYSLEGEAASILKRGCQGFIQKPFNIAELSRKVKTLLSRGPGN